MSFHFVGSLKNFIFKGWNAANAAGVTWTCIAVASVAIILEGLKLFQSHLSKQLNADPLTYARTPENLSERSALLRPLLLPRSLEHFQQRQKKYVVAQALTHVVHLVTAYLLMLAVMTYNAWILIAVVVGSGIGYFVFGSLRPEKNEQSNSAMVEPHTDQTYVSTENIQHSDLPNPDC